MALLVSVLEKQMPLFLVLTRSEEMVRKMALKKCQLGIFSFLLLSIKANKPCFVFVWPFHVIMKIHRIKYKKLKYQKIRKKNFFYKQMKI